MARTQDRFTTSQPNNQQFSDFLPDLTPHPVTGELTRFINENAINRALKNLILTNRGERLFQPAVGSDIYRMLFEPMTGSTAELIRGMIERTITTYEPRVKVIQVVVDPKFDENAYNVQIQYIVINRQTPVTFNVTLTRVR